MFKLISTILATCALFSASAEALRENKLPYAAQVPAAQSLIQALDVDTQPFQFKGITLGSVSMMETQWDAPVFNLKSTACIPYDSDAKIYSFSGTYGIHMEWQGFATKRRDWQWVTPLPLVNCYVYGQDLRKAFGKDVDTQVLAVTQKVPTEDTYSRGGNGSVRFIGLNIRNFSYGSVNEARTFADDSVAFFTQKYGKPVTSSVIRDKAALSVFHAKSKATCVKYLHRQPSELLIQTTADRFTQAPCGDWSSYGSSTVEAKEILSITEAKWDAGDYVVRVSSHMVTSVFTHTVHAHTMIQVLPRTYDNVIDNYAATIKNSLMLQAQQQKTKNSSDF